MCKNGDDDGGSQDHSKCKTEEEEELSKQQNWQT